MNYKPLSREFLLARGKCCKNSCAFCPYKNKNMELKSVMRDEIGVKGLNDLCQDIKEYFGDKEDLVIVEIGSYMGESTEVFAKNFPNAEIWAIDPWEGGYDENDSCSEANYTEVEQQFDLRTAKYKNIKKHKGFSTTTEIKYDVLYLDGNHSFEGVKADILHWTPLRNEKAIISGHDYCVDEEFLKIHKHIEGVKRAVDTFLLPPQKTYCDNSWMIKIN
jgi:hypothetical protein